MDRDAGWDDRDAGVVRLEDLLATLPFDRALPDLATLLRLAAVPASLVEHDERARKVLHEAILARPLARPEAVHRRQDEVEVLLLEVGLLVEVLKAAADGAASSAAGRAAVARLADIRARLSGLREGL
jgi:hypothetical protein